MDTDELNTRGNPWDGYSLCEGHFPPSAYSVLGERFARNACLLIDQDLEFDDDVFTAKHFDSADKIAGHAAIGLSVSGSQPLKGSLKALTDGKFGDVGSVEDGWVRFAMTGEEPVELLLDLGEKRIIRELGLSLLYDPRGDSTLPQAMTMEISSDMQEWQSLNRRNFSFIEKSFGSPTCGGMRSVHTAQTPTERRGYNGAGRAARLH